MVTKYMMSVCEKAVRKKTSKVTPIPKTSNASQLCFYESMRKTLLSAHLFGFLPIKGLEHHNSDMTRFCLKSPYTILLVANILSMGFTIFWIIADTCMDFGRLKLSGAFYNGLNFASALIFLQFSVKWKKMIGKIEFFEKTLPALKQPTICSNIKDWILLISFIAGIGEQLFFYVSLVDKVNLCNSFIGDLKTDITTFFKIVNSFYFNYFPFGYAIAVFMEFAKIQATMVYILTDVLIINCSLFLNSRFEDFNSRVAKLTHRPEPHEISRCTWSEMQKEYSILTKLVKVVNNNIKSFVFISFLLNLVRIGQQIFFILSKQSKSLASSDCFDKDGAVGIMFLSISLVVMLGRILIVAFCAAQIHTKSREPLLYLRMVSSDVYDANVQKFTAQVYHSNICLTGLDYFYVTKEMILTMFATLLTYELMLMQFVVGDGNDDL